MRSVDRVPAASVIVVVTEKCPFADNNDRNATQQMPHRCVVIIKMSLFRKQCQIYIGYTIGYSRSHAGWCPAVGALNASRPGTSSGGRMVQRLVPCNIWNLPVKLRASDWSLEGWPDISRALAPCGRSCDTYCFEQSRPKLLAHKRKEGNQSWAEASERCMGVPNHLEERSTLLIVWLGHLGVNLVNLVYVSLFVVIIYYYLHVFWFRIH